PICAGEDVERDQPAALPCAAPGKDRHVRHHFPDHLRRRAKSDLLAVDADPRKTSRGRRAADARRDRADDSDALSGRRTPDRDQRHDRRQHHRPRVCLGGEPLSPRPAAERSLFHPIPAVHHRAQRRHRRERGGSGVVDSGDVVSGARRIASRSHGRHSRGSMKRAVAAIALMLLSCEPAVRRSVTLTFNDSADLVTISATTTLGDARPGTAEAAAVDDEREALLAGRDEWSLRFDSAEPESDRVVWQRKRGVLQSVEHMATIPSDNLQKFFYDSPLSINMIRGDGWAELTIVAGSSLRATRDQQQRVERTIERTSQRAATYFNAVRSMYLYLDARPQRATDMFTALFR